MKCGSSATVLRRPHGPPKLGDTPSFCKGRPILKIRECSSNLIYTNQCVGKPLTFETRTTLRSGSVWRVYLSIR